MPTVEMEHIDGNTGTLHIVNGWAVTVVATITGLPAPSSGNITGGYLYEAAYNSLVSFLSGSVQCRGITAVTYIEQFIPEVITPDMVKIRIVYKGFPNTQVEICTNLTQVESNLDVDGDVITVSYDYPADYPLDPNKQGVTVVQGGFISKPIPDTTVTYKYTTVSSAAAMVTKSQGLAGYLNSTVWALHAGDAHTWMCTSFRARSKDGGVTFEVEESYGYREDGWDFLVTFINPDDGKPPTDLVDGVGSVIVQGMPERVFASSIP